jgi:hypothetical protein
MPSNASGPVVRGAHLHSPPHRRGCTRQAAPLPRALSKCRSRADLGRRHLVRRRHGSGRAAAALTVRQVEGEAARPDRGRGVTLTDDPSASWPTRSVWAGARRCDFCGGSSRGSPPRTAAAEILMLIDRCFGRRESRPRRDSRLGGARVSRARRGEGRHSGQVATLTGAVWLRKASSSRLTSLVCVTHMTWGPPSIST